MSIKTVHKVCTLLVLAVGVIHTGGTFVFYGSLTEAAVWFAGAGLGGIFIAFLNMSLWPQPPRQLSRRLAAVANSLFLVWLVVGFTATPGVPQGVIAAVGTGMVVSAFMIGKAREAGTGRNI
jgi:hypothetical protein